MFNANIVTVLLDDECCKPSSIHKPLLLNDDKVLLEVGGEHLQNHHTVVIFDQLRDSGEYGPRCDGDIRVVILGAHLMNPVRFVVHHRFM